MGMTIDGSGRSNNMYRDPPSRERKARRAPTAPEDSSAAPARLTESPLASEQHRATVAALDLALQSAETAHGMLQSAEGGMARISVYLARMSVTAAQAAEPPAQHDGAVLRQLQTELQSALAGIREVVAQTRFGPTALLDGSLGCHGAAVGEGLSFARAGPQTRSSPPEGYVVRVSVPPREAAAAGELPLSATAMQDRLVLYIREGARLAQLEAQPHQSPSELAQALEVRAREHGIDVRVTLTPEQALFVCHRQYGRDHRLVLGSSVPGVLSHKDGRPRLVANGGDIRGTIHNEPAEGRGAVLTGGLGNLFTEGLSVRYTGPPQATPATPRAASPQGRVLREALYRTGETAQGREVGRVIVVQRARVLRLHAGDQHPMVLRIDAQHPEALGQAVENGSGFAHLGGLDIATPEAARDALLVLNAVQAEVTATRKALFDLSSGPLAATVARLKSQARELCMRPAGPVAPATTQALVYELRRTLRDDATLALMAQGHTPPGVLLRLVTDMGAPEQSPLSN